MPKRMVQAYKQAPWRIQTQRGTLILIAAILGASVLWVMVSVTVQAGTAGLQIQQLEGEKEDLTREIAAIQTNIGVLTSAAQMKQRAEDMGFEPVRPENIIYMVIPGYTGRESEVKAPPPGANIEQPLVKPAYTQSLWEWLLQGVLEVSNPAGGYSP